MDQALGFILDKLDQVQAAYPGKHIVIGEVGWPSDGVTVGGAVASRTNQALFLRRFSERRSAARARLLRHRGFRSALEDQLRGPGGRLLGHHGSRPARQMGDDRAGRRDPGLGRLGGRQRRRGASCSPGSCSPAGRTSVCRASCGRRADAGFRRQPRLRAAGDERQVSRRLCGRRSGCCWPSDRRCCFCCSWRIALSSPRRCGAGCGTAASSRSQRRPAHGCRKSRSMCRSATSRRRWCARRSMRSPISTTRISRCL